MPTPTRADIVAIIDAEMAALVGSAYTANQAAIRDKLLTAVAEGIINWPGTGGGLTISSANPQPLGTAAPGSTGDVSDAGHVHEMPSAADVGADPAGTAAAAVSTHVGLADPHTQYALESTLGSAAYTASTAYDAAGAAAAAQAASQPLDSDLTAIAALTTTAYGRALLELANQAALLALMPDMVGDAGAGGTHGLVPAPAAGDAAGNKVLGAGGAWVEQAAGSGDVVGPASATDGAPAVFDGATGKLLKQIIGEGVLGLVAGVLTKITTALGDLVYGGASGTATRLAGNTTTAQKVLTQTGDGAASAAPVWTAVSGLTVGDASNPGVLKLGVTDGAQPYDASLAPYKILGRCDPVSTIVASSSSGHIERDPHSPSLIRLKTQPMADAADAKASPPTGWTLSNSGKLTSASVSSNVLTMSHDTTTSSYTAGTATSPYYSRAFTAPPGGRIEIIFRQRQTSGPVANDVVKAGISYDAGRVTAGALIFATTGGSVFTMRITLNEVVAFSLTGKTSTEASTGWWVRFVVEPISGAVVAYYSAQASQPTTAAEWTWCAATMATGFQADGSWLYFATVTRTTGGSGACTGTFEFAAERVYQDTAYQTPYVPFGAGGYAATSDAIVFAASIDCGVARLPDETAMRAILADCANQLPGDAATWTWSVTGSASANPAAATTHQAAGSLTIKQAGSDSAAAAPGYRYWAIRGKAASASSAQAGSIDTSLVWLVAA